MYKLFGRSRFPLYYGTLLGVFLLVTVLTATLLVVASRKLEAAAEQSAVSVFNQTSLSGAADFRNEIARPGDRVQLQAPTANMITVLLDRNNNILGLRAGAALASPAQATPLAVLENNRGRLLGYFTRWNTPVGQHVTRIEDISGEKYILGQYGFELAPGVRYRIITAAPLKDFGANIQGMRGEILLIAFAVLLIAMAFGFAWSRRLSKALGGLVNDTRKMQGLDFSSGPPPPALFLEIDELGQAYAGMKSAMRERAAVPNNTPQQLENLIEMGLSLSMERNRMALLRKILFAGKTLVNCDAGTMYLVTDQGTLSFALRTKDDELPSFEIPLKDTETGAPNLHFVSTYVAIKNEIVKIDDVYAETRFDLSGTRRFDADSGYRTVSMLTVPMAPREGRVIGVLQFINALDPVTGAITTFKPEIIRLVSAMAAQAAVALDNHQLVEAQNNLMEALIRLIASAIDAKSPYTGGHCERVPELATMLAKEASKADSGSLAEFGFKTEDEWREFRIGAWLHDCGKVTTPEYVVDKATKLETIYNRIHEIRTRFEVVLRDAEIERLNAVLGGADAAEAASRFEARAQQLQDDFAFIAECNMGSEFMAPEHLQRLATIAGNVWLRHFDDRLGLSNEDLKRASVAPAPALPATEHLLADKAMHVVPRDKAKPFDPRFGFKVKVPHDLYNHGELHNLSISRGTLNEEERFKINEHIIQTIVILDKLPLPLNMQRVPEYAGTHHETLEGTGYPRKLGKDDLSIPARIMAIADIFEALTASDRPYKKTKTLSESIKILSFFKKDNHIDADLFDLFLSSGVYRAYAEKYMLPEQIDAVDLTLYIKVPEPHEFDLSKPPFQGAGGSQPELVAQSIVAAFERIKEWDDRAARCVAAVSEVAGLPDDTPLARACRTIAVEIDSGVGAGTGNPYHNRQHFCEIVLSSNFLASQAGLTSEERQLLTAAALIHDFHHDGATNGAIGFRLEQIACDTARPYVDAAGVGEAERMRLEALVLSTDVVLGVPYARACFAYHFKHQQLAKFEDLPAQLTQLADDPRLAMIAVILTEADVLPSVGLTMAYGELQQQLLARELGRQLGADDKLSFIENVFRGFEVGHFFTPNVEVIKTAMKRRVEGEADTGKAE